MEKQIQIQEYLETCQKIVKEKLHNGIQSIYIYWENLTGKIIIVIIHFSQHNY